MVITSKHNTQSENDQIIRVQSVLNLLEHRSSFLGYEVKSGLLGSTIFHDRGKMVVESDGTINLVCRPYDSGKVAIDDIVDIFDAFTRVCNRKCVQERVADQELVCGVTCDELGRGVEYTTNPPQYRCKRYNVLRHVGSVCVKQDGLVGVTTSASSSSLDDSFTVSLKDGGSNGTIHTRSTETEEL